MNEILILNGEMVYRPLLSGTVNVSFALETVGKLEFSVVKDKGLIFHEGAPVSFMVDKSPFFKGFVFAKGRSKENLIKVTCYDQMRYLKNKDTYQYGGISYSELFQQICRQRGLAVGAVEDTAYRLPERIEKNKELLQILQTAGEITMKNTGRVYFLADEAGKLCLRDIAKTKVNVPFTAENISDYEVTTSIEHSYNRIKLGYETEDKRLFHKSIEDEKNIERWGILQHYEIVKTKENIEERARQMLQLYNRIGRTLKLKKVIGDTRVREGRIVAVLLKGLLDIDAKESMLVTEATHTFEGSYHFMDLTLQGERIWT